MKLCLNTIFRRWYKSRNTRDKLTRLDEFANLREIYDVQSCDQHQYQTKESIQTFYNGLKTKKSVNSHLWKRNSRIVMLPLSALYYNWPRVSHLQTNTHHAQTPTKTINFYLFLWSYFDNGILGNFLSKLFNQLFCVLWLHKENHDS